MEKAPIHILFCPKCNKLTDQEDYGLTYDEENIIIYRKCTDCGEYLKITINHVEENGGYKAEVIKKEDIPKEFLERKESTAPWYIT